MENKFLAWLRTLTLGVLIVLGCLHFKNILLSAMSIDVTKLTVTQLISYEWIVPLVSFFALLGRRRQIGVEAKLPTWTGLALTSIFLVVLSLAARSGKPPFQLLAMAGLIYAVGYAFWGSGVAALLLFPMSFLVFAVPVSFYLTSVQALSPALAEGMTRAGASTELLGFEYVRDLLDLKSFNLKPVSASSGIHMLFGMAAITVAFAHFTVKTRQQRWLLYLLGIPIALLAIFARAFFVCLIATLSDNDLATRFYTLFSHYVAFFLCLLLIFMFANVVIKITEHFQKPTAKEWLKSLENHEAQITKTPQSVLKPLAIVFLVLVLAVAAFFFAKENKPSESAQQTPSPAPLQEAQPAT